MDGTEKSLDPGVSQTPVAKLQSSKEEHVSNASNNADNSHRLPTLSNWMEQNNKKNDGSNEANASMSEMPESHQQQYHQHQQSQQQRLSMEEATTSPSSGIGSNSIELGVNEGIGEEEEEDSRNFVSTLDVDAIKRSPASSTMQLPSYPPSVPSGCTLSRNDQRSSTPGSHLLHRAVENTSIINTSSLSTNDGNHLLHPSSSSNNKAPLMTINENWAALDASTMPQPPMTLSTESKRRADNANFSSLPNSTFHAIRSNYSVKNRQHISHTNDSRSKQSSSSSPKSHHRRHQAMERRQNRENKAMQHHKTKLAEDNIASRKQSHSSYKHVSSKEDTEYHSDHASEDSDSDSSDSSDCSRSASISRSDTQSRHDGNASSDDDSGSNVSRSGSSSSYSSDEEDDDSSSSSCCSSQSCTKRNPVHRKQENSSEGAQSHRKSSVIRSKVSKTSSNNSATSDISESNRNNATSDITDNGSIPPYPDLHFSSSSIAGGSSREGRDLLGANMYPIPSPGSNNIPLPALPFPTASSSTMSGESNDKLSGHQVTIGKDMDSSKLDDTNSIPTNVSNLSTINISQADDSLGYSMCYSSSSQAGLETLSSNTKDNFSKPFPPKSDFRKSETIRSTNSHLSNSEASDNLNKSASDVHNINKSDINSESIKKQNENSVLSTIPILETDDIHGIPQSLKKVPKFDKKVANEKVCHSGSVYRTQLHSTNQSNDCDNSANAATATRCNPTADTIDQHTSGDNKSTVDGAEGTTASTSSSSSATTEIAHFAEQLDSISDDEEGGEDSGETSLNSITGGLQVIEDEDLVAILKDVSACVSESTTGVEFSNSLHNTSDSHEEVGHHSKSDHHRKHHPSPNTTSSTRSVPSSVSSIDSIHDHHPPMQMNHIIESPSSLCHQQQISTSGHHSVVDNNTSTIASNLSKVNASASVNIYANSDKSNNVTGASVSHKSTKHNSSQSDAAGSINSKIAACVNVNVSDTKHDNSDKSSLQPSQGTKSLHCSTDHKSKHHNQKKRRSRNAGKSSSRPPGTLVPLLPAQPNTLTKQFAKRSLSLSHTQQIVQSHQRPSLPEVHSQDGTTSITTIVQQTQNLQNSSVQVYQQQQVQQDIDLYLNSSTSNVSPDSGIQSEGGGGMANSSPLHLTESTSLTASSATLNVQSPASQQPLTGQSQTSVQQLNSHTSSSNIVTSQSPSTQRQTVHQFSSMSPQGTIISSRTQQTAAANNSNWAQNASIAYPATLSPMQHSPGAFYGSYVQPSPNAASGHSPSPPAGSAQFSTMVATQTAYVYHSPGGIAANNAPVLLSSIASVSSNNTGQTIRLPLQANQATLSQIGNSETPPPTLLPAISSIHLSPLSTKSHAIYPTIKPKCPSSSSSSSAGSGNESNAKRGRGRPKGSKNKIRKKVTMTECGSQTMESSLDRVMYASNRATSPTEDSEDDDSDSASDCASTDLPPPPVFMGPATNLEPLKASRGRPRKDPPMLIPQVAKPMHNTSPTEKPKHVLLHLDKEVPLSRVRTISKTPLKGAKSAEVILLESDDSTVFSDEDDAEDEDEDDLPTHTQGPPKLPLPSITRIKSSGQKELIHPVKKIQQMPNIHQKSRHNPSQSQSKIDDIPPSLDIVNSEDNRLATSRIPSPYSEPPVLKVENRSESPEITPESPRLPPSLPLQRNEPSSHSGRSRSEKKKKKKKKKSKSKSKHRRRNDEDRHRSKSPYERDSSYSPIRSKSRVSSSHSTKRVESESRSISKETRKPTQSDIKKTKKKSSKTSNKKREDVQDQIPGLEEKRTEQFSFIKGNNVPKVFDEKYCNLKPQEFWKGTNLSETTHEGVSNPQNNAKVPKKSKGKDNAKSSKDGKISDPIVADAVTEEDQKKSEREMFKGNCRVLTKASLKEIGPSVPNYHKNAALTSSVPPPNGGLPTKTLLNILASTSKQKSKPGRKKKKVQASEWSESDTIIDRKGNKTKHHLFHDQDESPGSSSHSNKSPFSPRSSLGSASVGSDHGQINNSSASTTEVKYGSMLDCSQGYKTFKTKSAKKQKKEKRSEAASGGWKTKHKNVIDPVFLGEVEYLIQDVASCQLEVSKVSRDYWPDRPLDSVPSIFRRHKISGNRAKRLFAELIEAGRIPHLPILNAQKHYGVAPSKTVATIKEKPKRGRPKKNSQDGAVPSNTSGTKSTTESGMNVVPPTRKSQSGASASTSSETGSNASAEQRLPLKKRHRHHIPAKGGGGTANEETVNVDSESGNSSSGCALSPPITNTTNLPVSSRRHSAAKQSRENSVSSASDNKSKVKEDNENTHKGRSSRKSSTDKKQEDSMQSIANRKSFEAAERVGNSRRTSSANEKSLTTVKIKLGKTSGSSYAAKNLSDSYQTATSSYSSSSFNNEAKVCSIEPISRKDGKSARDLQYENRYHKMGNNGSLETTIPSSGGNKPIIPTNNTSTNGPAPMKSLNIVDSLASCIDKYTGSKSSSTSLEITNTNSSSNSGGDNSSVQCSSSNNSAVHHQASPPTLSRLSNEEQQKQQQNSNVYNSKDSKHELSSNVTKPLTVKTSLPKCSVPTTSSYSHESEAPSSPRKRHLLQMKQNESLDAPDLIPSYKEQIPVREPRQDLAPPLLEKISLPHSRSGFDRKKVCAVTPTIVSNPRSLIEKHRQHQQNRRLELCKDRFSAPPNSCSKSLSPPRLSPPRLSPPHTTDFITASIDNLSPNSPHLSSKRASLNQSVPHDREEKRSQIELSQTKYKPNYSDISDDENVTATVSPLTIKLKPTPAIPNNAMPMNTSKDAEEAFDRLKKEDEKIHNDPKRLQKEVSRRLLQRNETAADRILQKQYQLLQQDQQSDIESKEMAVKESSPSPSAMARESISNIDSSKCGTEEELEISSQRAEKGDPDDQDKERNKSPDQAESAHQARSSSVSPVDAPVSLPSDNCDYMELECEIEPFDDESSTPIPPETSPDTQTKKTTAVVAPTGFKKRKASGCDKKRETNKSKMQRKQQQQQRRVLTIRVKKLKEKDGDHEENDTNDNISQEHEKEVETSPTSDSNDTIKVAEKTMKSKKGKSKEEASEAKSSTTATKARKRKRKANKTGFPSVKKKKKKQNPFVDSDKSSSRSSSTPRTSRPSSVAEVREGKKQPAAPIRSSSRVQAIEEAKKSTEVEESSNEAKIESDPTIDEKQNIEIVSTANQLSRDNSDSKSEDSSSTEIAPDSSLNEIAEKLDNSNIKKPRGRPPKKKQTTETQATVDNEERKISHSIDNRTTQLETSLSTSLTNLLDKRPRDESEESQRSSKRSRLYTDEIDEEIDCLSLLPTTGMESGLSSEAPSVAGSETEGDTKSTTSSSTSNRKKKKKTTLTKKKSLVAGLFSDYYKGCSQDSTNSRVANREVSPSVNRRWAYNVEEHIHGLLPPPYYCGRQLRQKKEDFQLPYDLWWLHANKQLPGRDVVATWNYKRIKNNVYFDIKPIAKDLEGHACQCDAFDPSPEKCGEDCINRMTYTECDPKLCPSGERCTNNSIQKHRTAPGIERFMTKEKGWGIRTKNEIKSGVFIMEYVGEVVSEKEFKLRMHHEYADDNHHYCLHMDGSMVIDGHRMGGECRFVNHSCNPNCEMQKWSVNGLFRMALFSLEDIKPNEELTYDYNFSLFNPHEGQICRCGAKDCRGVIGGRSQRINGPPTSTNGISLDASAKDADEKKKCNNGNNSSAKTKRSERNSSSSNQISRLLLLAPIKPLGEDEILSVRKYRCFLFRNFEKVRKLRDYLQQKMSGQLNKNGNGVSSDSILNNNNKEEVIPKSEEMILTGLTALTTARSMQTRRLAIAQDDPKVTKVVKLAQVLREIFAQVATLNDENGKTLSKSLQNLPSKKKQPQYYNIMPDPIDLQTIERYINTGAYSSPDQFDKDILRSFQNAFRFFGNFSVEGSAALKLRKVYNNIKSEYIDALSEIVGETEKNTIQAFKSTIFKSDTDEGEDRIECLCGQYKDEGLMIQCEKCQVWQHCDCVGQTGENDDSYLCPQCGDREANLDIPLVPQPEYASPGEKYFVSLSRCENLQVRVGDTVYVLRAFKNKSEDTGANNEGLLKIAPAKPKQKKKSQDKKKETAHAKKTEAGGEKNCDKETSVQGANEDITQTEKNDKEVVDNSSPAELMSSSEKDSSVKNSMTSEENASRKNELNDRESKESTKAVSLSGSNAESNKESTTLGEIKNTEEDKIVLDAKESSEISETNNKAPQDSIDLSNTPLTKDPSPKETSQSEQKETPNEGETPKPLLSPPHIEINEPGENVSSKSELEKKKSKEKDQFCHGGIPHKMMSPTKGPALEASSLAKGSYPTYKSVDPTTLSTDDMDIFRIERLWVNESGQRFAFGHHYLRPHETFHEPSRRFFQNEVFRVPIYEVLPLDTIWRQCWVLDLQTFCKGRPVGALEEHVYICENRVDKTARLFHKISKPKYPICVKWFAFNVFDLKLRPQRTYTPHEVPDTYSKKTAQNSSNKQRSQAEDNEKVQHSNKLDNNLTPSTSSSVSNSKQSASRTKSNNSNNGKGKGKNNTSQQQLDPHQPFQSSSNASSSLSSNAANKNKNKLEDTLLKLLSKMPKKNAVDASYLLEHDKRSRKRKIM